MNIEQLGRKAIEIIKQKWGIPKSGLVAGGSIANIVWEIVSGNKAVINDVDIFHFDGLIESVNVDVDESIFKYKEIENKYYEDYTGMCFHNVTRDFYTVVESTKNGIFNNIKYKSNKQNPEIILRSFDINSTKIGYLIEEDRIIWTKEFEDFLKTGELMVCNLMTPSHTAIRILKKKNELNAKLNDFEIKLIQHSLDCRFNDIIKLRFMDRYFDIYQSLGTQVSEYFKIERDIDSEEYVKLHHLKSVNLYKLIPVITKEEESVPLLEIYRGIFNDTNIQNIHNSITFLFYMRNIYGNEELEKIWSRLHYFYNDVNYIDKEVTKEDFELLERFSKYAPNSIENLKGLKISEQINLIKKFLDKFKEDPIIGISILEKYKIEPNIELDDSTILILELAVRKQIINDTKGKVHLIQTDQEKNDDLERIF